MSAYIVSHATLNAMLTFGARGDDPLRLQLDGAPLYFDSPDDLQRAAAILLAENVRSVKARYGLRAQPEPITFRYCHTEAHLAPVQVLKLCDCFDYQACETGDYPETAAARIVAAIRVKATRALPGYRRAEWGLA
jgi:hypothetical protein